MSSCKQRHGAVVVRSGKVLHKAFNVDKNSPRYLSDHHINNYASVHAEVAALRKVKNPYGATVYVARARRRDKIGLSKPCNSCAILLRQLNCRVVYTENDFDPIFQYLQRSSA